MIALLVQGLGPDIADADDLAELGLLLVPGYMGPRDPPRADDADLQLRLGQDRASSPGVAGSDEPVSYTHLDVYKRQVTSSPRLTGGSS